jgi:hypothetical protein
MSQMKSPIETLFKKTNFCVYMAKDALSTQLPR